MQELRVGSQKAPTEEPTGLRCRTPAITQSLWRLARLTRVSCWRWRPRLDTRASSTAAKMVDSRGAGDPDPAQASLQSPSLRVAATRHGAHWLRVTLRTGCSACFAIRQFEGQ